MKIFPGFLSRENFSHNTFFPGDFSRQCKIFPYCLPGPGKFCTVIFFPGRTLFSTTPVTIKKILVDNPLPDHPCWSLQPSGSGHATAPVSPKFRNRARIEPRSGSNDPLFDTKLLEFLHEQGVRQIITILHPAGTLVSARPVCN